MRTYPLFALIAPTVIGIGMLAVPTFALQSNSSAYPTASSALSAAITSKLDTKKATVGEAVTAKTLRDDACEWHFRPQRRDSQRKSDRGTVQVLRRRNRVGDHLI